MAHYNIKTIVICILSLSSITMAKHKLSRNKSEDQGQCTLNYNGCEYELIMKNSNCMQSDEGAVNSLERMLGKQSALSQDGEGQNTDRGQSTLEVEVSRTRSGPELKKLDQLEKKLTKMMEGLSVRSLRHIRQIRNDLRQMTLSMDVLKSQAGPRKHSKRGLSCPAEFISVGTWSSCYRFSTFNTTWHEAREYCSAFGADLVALDTQKEAYILDYLIKSSPAYAAALGWWTGGTYVARSRQWMWTAHNGLTAMEFMRWAPGEPNARSVAHCLLMYRYADYMWTDGICSHHQHFICEMELY